MKNYYTLQERISIVKWHYGGNLLHQIRGLFAGNFAESQIPWTSTIRKVIKGFEERGSVDLPCKCKKIALNRHTENTEDVLLRKSEYISEKCCG